MNKRIPTVNRITEYRMAKGWSQRELAELAGVEWGTVRNAEQGVNQPNVGLALRLAESLGVRVEDLFQLKTSDADTRSAPAQVRHRASSVTSRLDRIERMLAQFMESRPSEDALPDPSSAGDG